MGSVILQSYKLKEQIRLVGLTLQNGLLSQKDCTYKERYNIETKSTLAICETPSAPKSCSKIFIRFDTQKEDILNNNQHCQQNNNNKNNKQQPILESLHQQYKITDYSIIILFIISKTKLSFIYYLTYYYYLFIYFQISLYICIRD
ncbi:hypothetical protein ABPG74_006395 [Tetrahymena malaccensis]